MVMGLLAKALQVQLSLNIVLQTPRREVEQILRELPGPPLVPAFNRQGQDDGAECVSLDTVTLDAIIALAGPAQDLASLGCHTFRVLGRWRDHVAESATATSHQASAALA
jgi:hypothetical protein